MKAQNSDQSKVSLTQHLKLFSAVLLALLLSSCSHSTGTGAAEQAGSTASSDSLGKSSFSAVIDGTAVSGGVIRSMQTENAAFLIPDNKGGEPTLAFWLNDIKTAADDAQPTYALKFLLPRKMGPATNAYLGVNINLDKTHSAIYYSSHPTVVITSLDATRVAGTFSGTFKLSPDTPNVPKTEIAITDGKFDIPFATSKLIPF
jgi:hypothetical protein